MYEGDAPLAERRAQALTLDRDLLRDLLGQDELRELLDPRALDELELELQCLPDNRKARNIDQVHDLLRRLGDLSAEEVVARSIAGADVGAWLPQLEVEHRACRLRIGGEERWISIEDAGRYRDALGVSPPIGVPEAFLKPTPEPLDGLLARFARTHAPFLVGEPAMRWALPESLVRHALEQLEAAGSLLHGDFRPGGVEREWCDQDVLRMLRRRSLARLRKEVEPVDAAAFARFLGHWQGLGSGRGGVDRLRDALTQLEGLAVPASVLERDILPARVVDYQPRLLDELGATGEIAWLGRSRLGKDDGRVVLARRDHLPTFVTPAAVVVEDELQKQILELLSARGASFFTDLLAATSSKPAEVLEALWDLVWAGLITTDTFAPLRGLAWPKRGARNGNGNGHAATPRGRGSPIPPEAAGRWALAPSGNAITPT